MWQTCGYDLHHGIREGKRVLIGNAMHLQKWNSYLADMAANWADGCKWSHGQPSRDKNTMPFDPIGQNLYLTSANTINLNNAIQRWYDEVKDYNYDTRGCSGGCGHYTQVCKYRTLHMVTTTRLTLTWTLCRWWSRDFDVDSLQLVES